MLLSKLEVGKTQTKRGGKKWKDFRSKSKGAAMFPTLEIIAFLFFGFLMFVGVFV